MPLELKIDPATGVALGHFTGTVDLEESKRALTELWRRPDWPGIAVVWDIRQASVEATPDQIESVVHFILRNQPAPPPARVAFVAPGDENFATMRMFEGYRENPHTETRVLRDFDEAVSWALAARRSGG